MGFLIAALIFIIVFFIILTGYYYKSYREILFKLNNFNFKVEKLKNSDTSKIINELDSLIDSFLNHTFDITIEETFLDIQTDNPSMDPRNIEISEERKNVILEDTFNQFLSYLSDDFRDKLSLVYKEDKINDVILDKMYYKLTLYVYERNKLQKN